MSNADGIEKLVFSRLFFKESKNKKGELCYVGKVKIYKDIEGGKKKQYDGDKIVIGNTKGNEVCGINKEGRWDVTCRKMGKGDGYIVLFASYTFDKISFVQSDTSVQFLINGREEKLKTEDNKFIPLSFNAARWYDPTIILHNISRKLIFLQLPQDFNFVTWGESFLKACKEAENKYNKSLLKDKQDSRKGNKFESFGELSNKFTGKKVK